MHISNSSVVCGLVKCMCGFSGHPMRSGQVLRGQGFIRGPVNSLYWYYDGHCPGVGSSDFLPLYLT